ncbi:MAG: TlpA disulfide reductase family protein [Methylomonas lenta]|nr:TlpA disulfide reductase family protein [Methylomonas lenta]
MRHAAWSYVLLLGLLAAISTGCNRHKGLQIGDPVPNVSLQDIHGKAVALPQDLNGKVWLVRFWALDCELCDKDILFGLESLYQKYKERNFIPVAVAVGSFDPKDERWQRFHSLTYPILVDERGLVAKKFGVIGLPTNFVVDDEGVLRDKLIGNAGLSEFEKLFTTILK